MHTRLKKGKQIAALLRVLCVPQRFTNHYSELVAVINVLIKELVEYAVLPQKVEYEVSQRQRFGILAVSFQLH